MQPRCRRCPRQLPTSHSRPRRKLSIAQSGPADQTSEQKYGNMLQSRLATSRLRSQFGTPWGGPCGTAQRKAARNSLCRIFVRQTARVGSALRYGVAACTCLRTTALIPPRQTPERGVERDLDPAYVQFLVRKLRILVVYQHGGVHLEHDELAVAVETAIDAEIVEADAVADDPQRLVVGRAKDLLRSAQEALLLVLHPDAPPHLGAVAMELPAVSDRQMIGQDLFADE